MNDIINKECISLRECANQLCLEVHSKLQVPKIDSQVISTSQRHPSNVSNPDRPWKIAGGIAMAAGVLTIITSNSFWGYLLGAGGLASIYVGTTKKHSTSNSNSHSQETSSISGLDISERILNLTKEIEKKWKEKVEASKKEVQRAIESSHVDDQMKQLLMGETYYTERLNFDVSSFVDRLTLTNDINTANSIIEEYKDNMCANIRSVCESQVKIYTNISDQL